MNQTPEQIARDAIDKQLTACGWIIHNKNEINLTAGIGVAVRKYQTDIRPTKYMLFVDTKFLGIFEAKSRGWLRAKIVIRIIKHH